MWEPTYQVFEIQIVNKVILSEYRYLLISTGSIHSSFQRFNFSNIPFRIIIFHLFSLGLLVASYWWASQVTQMSQEGQRSFTTLGIYGALVGSSFLGNIVVSFLVCLILLLASEMLHNKMVLAVLKAPVLFFDKTPVGRILNRFSKDISVMDDDLPTRFLLAVEVSLFSISTVLLPIAANAWLILVAIPVVAVVLCYGRYYIKSSREIKRLEAITCSPVYSHILETVAGLEVIRSSQMEQGFLKSLFR